MKRNTQAIISGIIAAQQSNRKPTGKITEKLRYPQENPLSITDTGKKVININYTNFQVFGDLIEYNQKGHIDRLYIVSPEFNSFKIWKDGELWYSGDPDYYANLGFLVFDTVTNRYIMTILNIDFNTMAASIDNGIVLYIYNVQGYLDNS